MQIFVNTNYDFVKYRFAAVAFSLVLMIIGGVLFMQRGVNWGIDFAGGANVALKFRGNPPIDRLRAELKDASIQQYGKPEENALLIRLPKQKTESDYAGQVVQKLLRDLNPESNSAKLDINYWGRDRLTDLLLEADPDTKGTRPEARDYYAKVSDSVWFIARLSCSSSVARVFSFLRFSRTRS